MSENFKTIEWKDDQLFLIDQRILPQEEKYLAYSAYKDVAGAIKDMVVRGAPAIGVTAAFAVVLAARESEATSYADFKRDIESACDVLFSTRPTAVNLKWGLERMKKIVNDADGGAQHAVPLLKDRLLQEAQTILTEDIKINRKIGGHGATLLESGQTVLTHCNAGALATAGHGTALGVIYSAIEAGKVLQVFADETRPFLQGARLTAWELAKNNVPVTLITDNMAGYFMKQGKIQCVIVGADRIAANGDVANKIGTYNVAILAKEHGIPFYVAAPLSTIDQETPTGEQIPIEERPTEEVSNFYRQAVAPEGIEVRNPAFDITPNELVTAIVTERGILRAPYGAAIEKVFKDG